MITLVLINSFLCAFFRVFLLEVLTDKKYRGIIKFEGDDGEFKIIKPNALASIWGNRKGNRKMTYEKFSRGLRYYYGGPILSKIKGKRLVYRFICDLKEIIGFNVQELSYMMNGLSKQTRYRHYAGGWVDGQ